MKLVLAFLRWGDIRTKVHVLTAYSFGRVKAFALRGILLFLPYSLTLGVLVCLGVVLTKGETRMDKAASYWGAGSFIFLMILLVLKAKGISLGLVFHRIFFSLAFAGMITAIFVLGYRATETFYEEIVLPEPWISGYVFSGVVDRTIKRKGQYLELSIALGSIGTGDRRETCRILYTDSVQLLKWNLRRRFRVKIKSRSGSHDSGFEQVSAGSHVIIRPYYYLSTATLENASYQKYLYHKQQVGTLYVYEEDFFSRELHPIFGMSIWLDAFVRERLERLIAKDALARLWNGTFSAASIEDSSLEDSSSVVGGEDDPPASLSLALLTGDKTWLSPQTVRLFRESGTYHVLAASGMHTGLLILIFFMLLRLLPLRRLEARALTIIFLLPLYLLLVGPRVSVLRSVLMVSVGFFWVLRDRRLPLEIIWAQVLLLMVLVSPHYLWDVSFQLSFSAVLGVILAVKLLQAYRGRGWFLSSLMISLSCQVFTMPFILYYFGSAPVLALFYNLFIPFLVMLSLAGTFLVLIIPFPVLASVLGLSLAYLNDSIIGLLNILLQKLPGPVLEYDMWARFFLKGFPQLFPPSLSQAMATGTTEKLVVCSILGMGIVLGGFLFYYLPYGWEREKH